MDQHRQRNQSTKWTRSINHSVNRIRTTYVHFGGESLFVITNLAIEIRISNHVDATEKTRVRDDRGGDVLTGEC